MTMLPEILALPRYWVVWIFWLIAINSASVFFLRRPEGRVVLLAWLGNAIVMTLVFEWNGFNRLLGASHVLFWTPLLVWLWRRRERWPAARATRLWVQALFCTNLASLLIDYVDVGRYLLGDRD